MKTTVRQLFSLHTNSGVCNISKFPRYSRAKLLSGYISSTNYPFPPTCDLASFFVFFSLFSPPSCQHCAHHSFLRSWDNPISDLILHVCLRVVSRKVQELQVWTSAAFIEPYVCANVVLLTRAFGELTSALVRHNEREREERWRYPDTRNWNWRPIVF